MSNLLLEAITDALEIRNVSPVILNKVPSLVSRAIVDLQRDHILPPKNWEFISRQEEREHRTPTGDFLFKYYKLPEDYRTLEELYIKGKVAYQYVDYDNYLNNSNKKNCFTITFYNIEKDSEPKPILILNPFPEKDDYIKLSYYINGKQDNYDFYSEEYYSAVIHKVEELVGLPSMQLAEDTATDVARQWRNRKGRNSINKTIDRIKPFRL